MNLHEQKRTATTGTFVNDTTGILFIETTETTIPLHPGEQIELDTNKVKRIYSAAYAEKHGTQESEQ